MLTIGIMRILLALLMFSCPAKATDGWIANVFPDDHPRSGFAVIVYDPERGESTFQAAVDSLITDGHVHRLDGVALHGLLDDPIFQNEVYSAVKQMAPKELAKAERSQAKYYFPQTTELRKAFADAVLGSPTVKNMNSELVKVGLRVAEVGHEKLSLYGGNDQRRFRCFLSLRVIKDK